MPHEAQAGQRSVSHIEPRQVATHQQGALQRDTKFANPEPLFLRAPARISNLLSVISKFEALDALSQPVKDSSLQPAPLHIRRVQTRGTERMFIGRRQTSTSVMGKSSNKKQDVCIVDGKYTELQTANSTRETNKERPCWVHDQQLHRDAGSLNKPGSIRLKGGIWDPNAAPPPHRRSTLMSPLPSDQTAEAWRPKKVRDMISFFDGSASVATNTPVRISRALTPRTPLSRISLESGCNSLSLTYTTSSKVMSVDNRHVEIASPTRPSHLVMTKRGNRECSSKESRTVPLPRSRTHHAGQLSDPSTPRVDTLQARSQQSVSTTLRAKINHHSIIEDLSASKQRGRSQPKTVRGSYRNFVNRREISEKIEQILHAKNLERDKKHEASEADTINPPKAPLHSTAPKFSARTYQSARVAKLKNLFEGEPLAEQTTNQPPIILPAHDEEPLSTDVKANISITSNQPPTPPPLPTFSTHRSSNVSPKTVPRRNGMLTTNSKDTAKLSTSPSGTIGQGSWTKGKVILDRKKTFEDGHLARKWLKSVGRAQNTLSPCSNMMGSADMRTKDHIRANPRNNKRTLENPLTEDEIHSIFIELQVLEEADAPTKWMLPMNNMSYDIRGSKPTGTDGAASEKLFVSPFREEYKDVIIKEADCHLKEPRPLRALEMKRMLMLCRGRAGVLQLDKGRKQAFLSD